jgi:LuxR family maltose regulon positive regulatory protein
LAEALFLGHAAGYLRVFADEGAPMRALVGRLVAAQRTTQSAVRAVPLDYLGRLIRSFDEAPTDRGSRRGAVDAPPGLVEALTAREAEVLVLIAAGKSNPRIAEELVVTLDTVKKHVSHVLGKLGAANRTEAVTRARQLGLIA